MLDFHSILLVQDGAPRRAARGRERSGSSMLAHFHDSNSRAGFQCRFAPTLAVQSRAGSTAAPQRNNVSPDPSFDPPRRTGPA
jgi:hypothetical protein